MSTQIVGQRVTYHIMDPDPVFSSLSVLITKGNKGLLVDTQFSKADGDKIVAYAQAQKIDIETIFISYSDPDYYFGLDEILKAFPRARVLSTPANIARIRASYATKLQVWKDVLQEKTPDRIVIPEPLTGRTLDFEGETFDIVGSGIKRQAIYNATDRLLFGGNLIDGEEHIFMADAQNVPNMKKWVAALDEMLALNPAIVIPGHLAELKDFTATHIRFTKAYIEDFIAATEAAKTSADIVATMKAKYPALADGSLEMSANVVMGDMEWNAFDLPLSYSDLIGRQVDVLFETGYHFKLEYLEGNQMRWTSLKEDNYGESNVETIIVKDIVPSIINVNWVESTGISVTHVINLTEGVINGLILWNDPQAHGGRGVLNHKGTYKFL